jgi:hypothetical protein
MNENEYKIYQEIIEDVLRTDPKYEIFQIELIKKMMTRVLYIWSMRHQESSYNQGFSDLVMPFFIVFFNEYFPNLNNEDIIKIKESSLLNFNMEIFQNIESDIYWCFTDMMNKIHINYIQQSGVNQMIKKLKEIIKFADVDLFFHLQKLQINFVQFAFSWMNCYLTREFNIILIIRMWDTYFSEDDGFNNFHIFVCACLLLNFSDNLKQIDNFNEIIKFLKNLPTSNWTLENIEVLLAKAYQISVLFLKENQL